jgi:hypothetical protein
MAAIPHFMISSTLFDLKQVRADLSRFIVDELGSSVLASEWPSFPVDPDVDTIENCRRRVEREADILVLLIGGRTGRAVPPFTIQMTIGLPRADEITAAIDALGKNLIAVP